MKKKIIFAAVFIAMFLGVCIYHYNLNLKYEGSVPSNKWAKEVLISKGKVQGTPALKKVNDNYLTALRCDDNIKLILTDKLGAVLKESTIDINKVKPNDISLFVEGKEVYICYSLVQDSMESIHILNGQADQLKFKEVNTINDVRTKLKLDDDTLGYIKEDTLYALNFKTLKTQPKKLQVSEKNFVRLGTSCKNGEDVIITYVDTGNDIYSLIYNKGVFSEIHNIGVLQANSKVIFRELCSVVVDGRVHVIGQYLYDGSYIAQNEMSYSLKYNEEPQFASKFVIKSDETENGFLYCGEQIEINDIKAYEGKDKNKLIISTYLPGAKGSQYVNLVELTLEQNKELSEMQGQVVSMGVIGDKVSRTTYSSGSEAIEADTMVFMDPYGNNEANVYMTSTREDFKKANDGIRTAERKTAFLDLLQSVVYNFAYVVFYGSIWVIPTLAIFSILSLFEYKLSDVKRKLIFFSAYVACAIIKIFAIKKFTFQMYGWLIPSGFTFTTAVVYILMVAVVSAFYGYMNYKEDLEYNIMALNCTKPIIIDSYITLLMFVGFIK